MQWNKKYLIVSINQKIEIIDINQKKIINAIKFKKVSNISIIFFKKIIHPFYGESLLTIETNSSIKLWISNHNFN